MNPVRFWFAVFAVLGLVIVAPAWMYWTGKPLQGLPVHIRFMVSLMLPMTILLTLASWLQSG